MYMHTSLDLQFALRESLEASLREEKADGMSHTRTPTAVHTVRRRKPSP